MDKQALLEVASKLFAKSKGLEGFVVQDVYDWSGEFCKVRFWNESEQTKSFRSFHFEDGKPKPGMPKFEPGTMPLYGIDKVRDRGSKSCYVVEGEKCVDALWKLGIPAVTAGAADDINKPNWQALEGLKVVLWADNDDAGARMEPLVIGKLTGIASDIEAVDVKQLGLGPKGDCVNFIELNKIESVKDWKGLPKKPKTVGGRKVLKMGQLLELKIPKRKLLLGGWLKEKSTGMIHAIPGVGKTWVALSIAYAIGTGGKFWGWQASKAGVLYIDGEMGIEDIQERLALLKRSMPSEEEGEVFIQNAEWDDEALSINISKPEGQAAIWAILKDLKNIKVVIFDNISCLTSGDKAENEAESWTPVQHFAIKLKHAGYSVLFIHHSGKGGDQRGTSKKVDNLDYMIKLKRDVSWSSDKGASFTAVFEKARHARGGEIRDIEARLEQTEKGLEWVLTEQEDTLYQKVVEAYKADDDPKVRQIARDLGIGAGTVSKYVKKYKSFGDKGAIPDPVNDDDSDWDVELQATLLLDDNDV